MLAGAIEIRHQSAALAFLQRQRKLGGLVGCFLEKILECITAQIEPAFERTIDAHVEPRLDALAEKLYRHAVKQGSRQNGDEREQQHQPGSQARTEDACLEILAQPPELIGDERHEHHHQHAIEDHQQRVVPRKQRSVGAGRGEQKQENRAQNGAAQHDVADKTRREHAAHGTKLQRYHSDCNDQSRDASALIWNGLGSCATSSRKRTAAS